MIKNLSCVSCGSLKRFPHTFTTYTQTFHGGSYVVWQPPNFSFCKNYFLLRKDLPSS